MSTPPPPASASSSPSDDASRRAREALALIAEVAEVEVDAIRPEHELLADLRIDSPKALRLLMDLEDHFEVEVSDDEASRLRTVGDVVAFAERLV